MPILSRYAHLIALIGLLEITRIVSLKPVIAIVARVERSGTRGTEKPPHSASSMRALLTAFTDATYRVFYLRQQQRSL